MESSSECDIAFLLFSSTYTIKHWCYCSIFINSVLNIIFLFVLFILLARKYSNSSHSVMQLFLSSNIGFCSTTRVKSNYDNTLFVKYFLILSATKLVDSLDFLIFYLLFNSVGGCLSEVRSLEFFIVVKYYSLRSFRNLIK